MRDPTKRQLEVLRLLADGKQIKGIAYDLKITVKAVENHIVLLKAKLDANTIGHLVAQGFRKGILS